MRRTLLVVVCALLLVPTLWAQEARIFEIKHADVQAMAQILEVFNAKFVYNRDLKTISVQGSPETLAAIAETIARFDVPPEPAKNVELTFYMLLGSQSEAGSSTLPAELESVAKQLDSLFHYKGLTLMETAVMRVRDGSAGSTSGAAVYPGVPDGQLATYDIGFLGMRVSAGDDDAVVRLDRFSFGANVPVPFSSISKEGIREEGYQRGTSGIRTDIDVREGQKVVIGKTSLHGSGNHLILVVTADVVD